MRAWYADILGRINGDGVVNTVVTTTEEGGGKQARTRQASKSGGQRGGHNPGSPGRAASTDPPATVPPLHPSPTRPAATLENIHNTMSTTRGIAFFIVFFSALLLLVLCASSCGATRGARGTTARAASDAPALFNPTCTAGEASLPSRDAGDESESNAKNEKSGAAVSCPVPANGPPTAVRVLPIALHTHVSSPGTCADEERRVVVVSGGTGSPRWDVQFIGRLHGKNRAGPGTCTCSGGGVSGTGATVKVGTTPVPAPHVVRRPTYLLFWSTVLSIVSVGSVGVASVLRTGGGLCPRGARASSHRRWLRSAMIGFAVVSSGGGVGVSAAACTASTCCNVAIPKLPSTTTTISGSVCNQGTQRLIVLSHQFIPLFRHSDTFTSNACFTPHPNMQARFLRRWGNLSS